MNNRILVKNDGVLKDYSNKISSSFASNIELNYEQGDYIYIGSRLPFNHVYFETRLEPLVPVPEEPTVYPQGSVLVEYWNGLNWISMVDVLDSTNTLHESGHLEFTPSKDEWWQRWDTNHAGQSIPDLSDVTIYDKYWLRISFTEDLDPQLRLDYIGNVFCNDTDLGIEYPDLLRADVKSSFKSEKTNWNEQHKRSADILIKDLVDMGIIKEKGQILNWRDYTDCCIHKTAEIVFNSFGDSYRDNSVDARREYQQRLNKKIHRVDLDKNAIEAPRESFNTSGWLSR